MLRVVDERAPGGRKVAVCVDVRSTVVNLALTHIADEAGWARCSDEPTCDCLAVSDRCAPEGEPALDVLVVRDEPAACQEAVAAVMAGRARSIVLWDEPESLGVVLAALGREAVLIPERALDLARRAPQVTDRQREALRLLAAGVSSRCIALALHRSLSTTKRDIAELLAAFDVPNRTALVRRAVDLGFIRSVRETVPGGVAD